MYISWGTKSFRKKDGIAADFCAICRRPSAVDMEEIRTQPHVYHIGIGQGKVVGRVCRCRTCQSEWALQAGTVQRSVPIAYGQQASLNTLIEETFPRFLIVYGERLRQEETIMRDPLALSVEERMTLIAEPFFILENDVKTKEHKSGSVENFFSALGCLGTIGLLIATIVSFASSSPLWGFGLLFLTIGGTWLTMHLSNAGTNRFMRTSIYPRLASCLSPLRPSKEELEQIIPHIDTQAARQTKLAELLPMLEDARSHTRTAQPTAGSEDRPAPPPVINVPPIIKSDNPW